MENYRLLGEVYAALSQSCVERHKNIRHDSVADSFSHSPCISALQAQMEIKVFSAVIFM